MLTAWLIFKSFKSQLHIYRLKYTWLKSSEWLTLQGGGWKTEGCPGETSRVSRIIGKSHILSVPVVRTEDVQAIGLLGRHIDCPTTVLCGKEIRWLTIYSRRPGKGKWVNITERLTSNQNFKKDFLRIPYVHQWNGLILESIYPTESGKCKDINHAQK